MKNLQIIDQQMKLGQVKRITSNDILDYAEMLVGDTTKARIYYDKEKNVAQLDISDTDLNLANLSCGIQKSVLRDWIIVLKDIYNLMADENSDEEEY